MLEWAQNFPQPQSLLEFQERFLLLKEAHDFDLLNYCRLCPFTLPLWHPLQELPVLPLRSIWLSCVFESAFFENAGPVTFRMSI
jgi:hypothetical protein